MSSFRSAAVVAASRSTPQSLSQALFLLAVCVFVVYQVQDAALERMDDMSRELARPPIMAAFSITGEEGDGEEEEEEGGHEVEVAHLVQDGFEEIKTIVHVQVRREYS